TGSGTTSYERFAPSVARVIATAARSASASPAYATILCQVGGASRSSSTSVPTAMQTSGLTTAVIATDGARAPVASETCWTRNARMPAAANTQNSQLDSIPPSPSASSSAPLGFQSEADSP